jgi:hypothetical protein
MINTMPTNKNNLEQENVHLKAQVKALSTLNPALQLEPRA